MSRTVIQFVAAWIIVTAFNRVTLGQNAEKATLDKLVAAWKERGAKVKSMVLELDFKTTLTAGGKISPDAPELEGELTYSGERFVWLEREKMRDHLVHITWDVEQQTFIPLNQTFLFDGEAKWSFFEYPSRKLGFVSPSKENLYRSSPDFGPLFQQYLGFTPSVLLLNSIDGDVVGSEVADGRDCVVIQQSGKKFWVDPKRGWHIVRHERISSSPDGRRLQTFIDYAEDDQWGWLLKAWQVDFFGPRGLEKTTEWKVRSIKLNAEIDPIKFQMDFPRDTKVNDER